jgi:hypothetical protein
MILPQRVMAKTNIPTMYVYFVYTAVNIKRKKGFIKVPDVFAFLCANITIFAYMTLQCKQNIRTLSGYLFSPLLFGVKSLCTMKTMQLSDFRLRLHILVPLWHFLLYEEGLNSLFLLLVNLE